MIGRRRGVWVWPAAAGAVLAVAVVVGWRSGSMTDAAPVAAASTTWKLPRAIAENPQRDAAMLRARRPWGGAGSFHDIDSGPAAPSAQPWTLVGTVLRDEQRYALIRLGPASGKIEYRSVGQKLPDGSTVEKIDSDGIASAGGPGHRDRPALYRLFDKKTVSQ